MRSRSDGRGKISKPKTDASPPILQTLFPLQSRSALKSVSVRRIGISDATFYHWKAKYGGMDVNEARRLRQLEDENGRLKRIVAQQALDIDALKVVLSKKW
jgi:Transposase